MEICFGKFEEILKILRKFRCLILSEIRENLREFEKIMEILLR